MNTLGKNIQICREKRNMSREDLARKMRMGPKRIQDYETDNEIPSNNTLLRLCTVLDIPASELMGKSLHQVEHHA